jgi:hypothetical protein
MPVGAGLAVAGVGAVVGGVVSAKANNNATKAQMKAGSDALAYQKEQDQYLRSRYELEDQREQEARKAYQQYLAANGRGPAPQTSGTPSSMSPVAVAARAAVTQPGYSAQPTIRDMAPGAPPSPTVESGPVPVAAQSADVSTMPTIADTSRWSEWEPYLAQNRPA